MIPYVYVIVDTEPGYHMSIPSKNLIRLKYGRFDGNGKRRLFYYQSIEMAFCVSWLHTLLLYEHVSSHTLINLQWQLQAQQCERTCASVFLSLALDYHPSVLFSFL